MNPRVKAVQANHDFTLIVAFTDGSVRLFDMKPYLKIGVFQELTAPHLFNSVRPFLGSVQRKNGQDICPDTLYEESMVIGA